MHLGVTLPTFEDTSILRDVLSDALETRQYDAIEIRDPYDLQHVFNPSRYDELVRDLRNYYNPIVSLHLPYDSLVQCHSKTMREARRKSILTSIDYGLKHNAQYFVMHPLTRVRHLYVTDDATSQAYADFNKKELDLCMEDELEFLHTLHLGNLPVTIENVTGASQIGSTPESLLYLINTMTNFNVTLDLAHARVAGYCATDFIKALGNQIVHLHISGTHNAIDSHLALTQDDEHYQKDFSALLQSGFNKLITIEDPVVTKDRLHNNARCIRGYMGCEVRI